MEQQYRDQNLRERLFSPAQGSLYLASGITGLIFGVESDIGLKFSEAGQYAFFLATPSASFFYEFLRSTSKIPTSKEEVPNQSSSEEDDSKRLSFSRAYANADTPLQRLAIIADAVGSLVNAIGNYIKDRPKLIINGLSGSAVNLSITFSSAMTFKSLDLPQLAEYLIQKL